MKYSTNRLYLITNQKVLTPEEREGFLKVCNRTLKTTPKDRRNSLALLTMYECGLRAGELLKLKIKDFNPETHSAFIGSMKGSNARELPLRPLRSRELKSFILDEAGADGWHELDQDKRIFPISYERLYQVWDFYRPTAKKTLHTLRHTFAVDLYERTKDIKVVQLALGHRKIDNTMVYVDFWYSQNALRKLMHG